MSTFDAVSSPAAGGISSMATPLVDMPLFLLVMLLVSLGALVHAFVSRKNRAYSLGPSMGQGMATVVIWLPVALLGCSTVYFLARLAQHL